MKTFAILQKELREAIRNPLLVITVVVPALIFAAMPVVTVYVAALDPLTPAELEPFYQTDPGLRPLDPLSATQVVLVGQMMFLFLMVPAVVPLVIASFSIIGEKQARSLEPLLATPIRVWELLLGKSLAAFIPAMVGTLAAYLITVAGVWAFGTELTRQAVTSSIWLLSVLTLAPMLGVTAVELAVIVSSRVNDTRVAQQASIVLILPVMGLFVGRFSGQVLIGPTTILLASLGLLAINAALLAVAVRLFRRETILTEWK